MKTIVILDNYQSVALSLGPWERLAGRAMVTTIDRHIGDRAELAHQLAEAHVVVANRERTTIDGALLAELPQLELIVTSGMRNAAIDVAAAQALGVAVSGTSTLGYPTAELAWAMILGFMRSIPQETASLAQGGWQTRVGTGLRGKTLGVLGFGRIGSDVAKVGLAFGMDVLAHSRSLTPEKAQAQGVVSVSKEELFRRSDVLSVHLLLTPATRAAVDARCLALMKPTALFVNTSRAPLVDTPALIEALREGRLGGAALDVYDHEPLPPDDPIRAAPNTLLTPHLGYVTRENYRETFTQAVENIEAWLDGAPIRVIEPGAPAGH